MPHKRESERADVDPNVPIEIHRVRYDGWIYNGIPVARNVSMGGMRIVFSGDDLFEKTLEVKKEIDFVMTLPMGDPFSVSGVIRHLTRRPPEYAVGIMFQSLDENAMAELDNYVTIRKYLKDKAGISI